MRNNFQKLIALLFVVFLVNSVVAQKKIKEPKMVFVEGGTFKMGSLKGESDEQPEHDVTVKSFYISKTEITVGEYYQFCEESGWPKPEVPMWGDDEKLPVVNVSWKDAGAYALWLSRKTGKKFRLPTEAEWEFAARGGIKSGGYIYSGGKNPDKIAWYYETTYGSSAQHVASKAENELGIFDMSGNVWEWCKDSYTWKYYVEKDKDGYTKAISGGNYRVIRGGGWDSEASHCRTTNRDRDVPESKKDNLGFRVVYAD